MLHALELENFKAFGQRTRIEFAPITLIFGENSAGKSTILQALNLLKQTRESREQGSVLLPRAEGGISDLGSFQELLFDHNTDLSLVIRVELSSRRTRFLPRRLARAIGEQPTVGYEVSFRRRPNDNEVCLEHLLLLLGDNPNPVLRFEPTELEPEERRNLRQSPYYWRTRHPIRPSELRAAKCVAITEEGDLWSDAFEYCIQNSPEIVRSLELFSDETLGRKRADQSTLFAEENAYRDALKRAIAFYSRQFTMPEFVERMREAQIGAIVALDGFTAMPVPFTRSHDFPEFAATRQFGGPGRLRDVFGADAAALMFESARLLDDALELLFPMGPFRRPPERWYIFTGTSPKDVGYRGQLLPDLLFRRHELVEQTNQWLDRLGVGYHVDPKPVGTNSQDLFELRLVDQRRGKPIDVALSDVGFGISQLLPFVVQCLASEGQIITIEQPEVHVHPRLQSDLADLLIETTQEPRGHRFIIETHSEHLILRLLRRIRETSDGELPKGHPGLRPDQLSVIYVSRGEGGSVVQRLRVDERGEFIDRWPNGFFEERAKEIF